MKKIVFKIYMYISNMVLPTCLISKYVGLKVFWIFRTIQETFLHLNRIFIAEPLTKSYCEYVGEHVRIETKAYINGIGKLSLGNNTHLSGKVNIAFNQKLFPTRSLVIGRNTFIGHNCSFSITSILQLVIIAT